MWADSIYFSTNRHLSKSWCSFLFWHMCCLHRRLSFVRSERKAEPAEVGRMQLVCTARNQNMGKLETRFNLHLSWSVSPLEVECKTIWTWQRPGVEKVVSPALKPAISWKKPEYEVSPSLQLQGAYFLPRLFLEGSASVPEITTPALTRCKCHACLLRFQPHFPKSGLKTKPVCLVCFLSVWTRHDVHFTFVITRFCFCSLLVRSVAKRRRMGIGFLNR